MPPTSWQAPTCLEDISSELKYLDRWWKLNAYLTKGWVEYDFDKYHWGLHRPTILSDLSLEPFNIPCPTWGINRCTATVPWYQIDIYITAIWLWLHWISWEALHSKRCQCVTEWHCNCCTVILAMVMLKLSLSHMLYLIVQHLQIQQFSKYDQAQSLLLPHHWWCKKTLSAFQGIGVVNLMKSRLVDLIVQATVCHASLDQKVVSDLEWLFHKVLQMFLQTVFEV